ncbi:hypothetical protein DIPPA_32770 [Diplonema papillatum]|nr:hypothetical protein DIPPA_32770 [Diplonema papillatum]
MTMERNGVAVVIDGGLLMRRIGYVDGGSSWEVWEKIADAVEKSTGRTLAHATVVDVGPGEALTAFMRGRPREPSLIHAELNYRRSVRAFYEVAKTKLGANRVTLALCPVNDLPPESPETTPNTAVDEAFLTAGVWQRTVDVQVAVAALCYAFGSAKAANGAAVKPAALALVSDFDTNADGLVAAAAKAPGVSLYHCGWDAAKCLKGAEYIDLSAAVAAGDPLLPAPGAKKRKRGAGGGGFAGLVAIGALPPQVSERAVLGVPDFLRTFSDHLSEDLSSPAGVVEYQKCLRKASQRACEDVVVAALCYAKAANGAAVKLAALALVSDFDTNADGLVAAVGKVPGVSLYHCGWDAAKCLKGAEYIELSAAVAAGDPLLPAPGAKKRKRGAGGGGFAGLVAIGALPPQASERAVLGVPDFLRTFSDHLFEDLSSPAGVENQKCLRKASQRACDPPASRTSCKPSATTVRGFQTAYDIPPCCFLTQDF